MTTPLIEAIARAMEGVSWGIDGPDFPAFAQAALTAITEAGYACVPNDTAEALESAVYVVRNVTGVSEWHKLFGRDDPSDFDEDFRRWADHWQATHESVRAIATEQDQSISAAQGDAA